MRASIVTPWFFLLAACSGAASNDPFLADPGQPDVSHLEMLGEDGVDTPRDADAADATSCPVDAEIAPGLVITDRGALQGEVVKGVAVFRGVPYAKPPVGALRWQPPEPADCWPGVRLATAFGPACPQKDFEQGQPAATAAVIGDEDCLTVNVWAPVAEDGPHPVMVYVHGGGNVAGSASKQVFGTLLFDGQPLAEAYGVVVVTLQYRLGPLGFLALPELSAATSYGGSGNYGLMDQLAALGWVQRNIAAFGGDPARVMLFGESAGAVDTLALVASPLAAGLFSAALAQSGGANGKSLSTREAEGVAYLDELGCADAANRLACARALPPQDLVRPLEHPFEGGLVGGGGFGPTIDGHVLPAGPMALFQSGAYNRVPIVIGSNADETASTVAVGSMSPSMVTTAFAAFGAEASALLLAQYPPGNTNDSATAAWIRATTDAQFVCPSRELARTLTADPSSPVWRYFFRHTAPPNFGGDKGSFHGLELFYVFGALERIYGGAVARPEDEAVGGLMRRYWSRLAAHGDPNGDDDVAWPVYDPATDQVLEILPTPAVVQGVRTEACDLWAMIAAAVETNE
jgi:para-nitrobenzyl esterase